MADLSKLKKRLGPPPAMTATADILQAPETVPAAPKRTRSRPEDGRSARKTGRTVQFATRVSAEFDRRFRGRFQARQVADGGPFGAIAGGL